MLKGQAMHETFPGVQESLGSDVGLCSQMDGYMHMAAELRSLVWGFRGQSLEQVPVQPFVWHYASNREITERSERPGPGAMQSHTAVGKPQRAGPFPGRWTEPPLCRYYQGERWLQPPTASSCSAGGTCSPLQCPTAFSPSLVSTRAPFHSQALPHRDRSQSLQRGCSEPKFMLWPLPSKHHPSLHLLLLLHAAIRDGFHHGSKSLASLPHLPRGIRQCHCTQIRFVLFYTGSPSVHAPVEQDFERFYGRLPCFLVWKKGSRQALPFLAIVIASELMSYYCFLSF